MTTSLNPCHGFHFPAEVIEYAAWLHHCFSLRDAGTILAAGGVVASHGSIREWGLHFGWLFASTLERRRPKDRQPGNAKGMQARSAGDLGLGRCACGKRCTKATHRQPRRAWLSYKR